MKGVLAAVALLAAACASRAEPVSAVLIAGDPSLPVFDNAIDRMADDLSHAAARVERLSGAPRPGEEPATRARALAAVARMRPAPGGSCLVFATSHGVRGAGLYLALDEDVLPPADLDRALRSGCGDAPTVVVMSSCYSGVYARAPVAAPNRIVFTAARADRPSFGCQAGRTYTVFDACLLAAVERGATWRAAIDDTQGCVSRSETRDGERPSLPQVSVGAAMKGFGLFSSAP